MSKKLKMIKYRRTLSVLRSFQVFNALAHENVA